MTNTNQTIREFFTVVAPEGGFIVKVGDGSKDADGKRGFRRLKADPAEFPTEILTWIIERGLSCMHAEKLNNVPVEKGLKAAEMERILAELHNGNIPPQFQRGAAGGTTPTADPVRTLARQNAKAQLKLRFKARTGKGTVAKWVATDDAIAAYFTESGVWKDDKVDAWIETQKAAGKTDYMADAEAELNDLSENLDDI